MDLRIATVSLEDIALETGEFGAVNSESVSGQWYVELKQTWSFCGHVASF
jgi:hypothetical protein